MTSLLTADTPPLNWHETQPGYAGLIVVILLFIAAALLVRSFLTHARRAAEPWEGEGEADLDDADDPDGD